MPYVWPGHLRAPVPVAGTTDVHGIQELPLLDGDAPGVRNLLRQSVVEDHPPRQGFPNRSGGGARFVPRGGGYRHNEVDPRDWREASQADTLCPRQDGREDQGRYQLPQGVQNATMYLNEWAGDPTSLPTERGGGEPVLAGPQISKRPDFATQGHEVS